ncbi:MAG TPA: hypothetical protein VFH91_09075 [Pyrinomonadaceae bacterium]|nr:hypothetical protein [Pyrinomonadaceae bacterium]
MFWEPTEPVLFFAALASFLIVLEIGFRVGLRQRPRSDEVGKAHVNALQAALLGLLALLLGFNFAMAASRFDARKNLIEEEVNAIETTYLRAQLLPSPQRQQADDLIRSYIDARLEFMRAGNDQAQLQKSYLDGSRIARQLWDMSSAMVAQDQSGGPKSMFISSLNDLINVNEKRRVALDNHVPELVIYLLFTVAVGAMGFIAYGYGLTGRRRHGTTAFYAVLIALVLTTILDLDQPRSGLIRVSEDSMVHLKGSLDQNLP